jgi:hypothetical protein
MQANTEDTVTGVKAADPDRACEHPDFGASVEVNRLYADPDGPIDGYMADLRIWCAACKEKFRFNGVPAGAMPNRPACSVDETELHVPIRPASADPSFGLGIPGFAVRFVERENPL